MERAVPAVRFLFWALAAVPALASSATPAAMLFSPDRHIGVDVRVTPAHTLEYSIERDGRPVILPSGLGLQLDGADLASHLALARVSPVRAVLDRYRLAVGKKRDITYRANERVFSVRNPRGQAMDVTFRVSNDGVAFRYTVRGPASKELGFVSESTGFTFGDGAKAWLQPMSIAKTGYADTNPSYEEHYQRGIAPGTPSPLAGWVFPALFKTGDTWVAITEAGMDGSFHASRLQPGASANAVRIAPPSAPEVFPGGALLAHARETLTSPWRIVALGSLGTLVESTLGTDLAAPARPFDKARMSPDGAPGHASWSWALLKDDATVFDVQKRFVDYAAAMRWDYTLVDADWDRKIGYARLGELAAYAATKHVKLLAWYNSSGDWNKTTYSPKSQLLTHDRRVAEFARLRTLGIAGVKIDFFGGDGQSMIRYYVDILQDALDAGLLVNFHGATLPRGWARTWPNLMTTEAVRGFEYTTFTQEDQDAVPRHAAMLPFTRNLFDPMDFTPMVFGDIPKIKRATRNGFELAESVLFLSGIQHFAETPEGMATAPGYVKTFLRTLPRRWDDVHFVAGEPGRQAVIARAGDGAWIVAGLNADDQDVTLDLDLSFLKGRSGRLITDGDGERDFAQATLHGGAHQPVTIKAHGGFVARFE